VLAARWVAASVEFAWAGVRAGTGAGEAAGGGRDAEVGMNNAPFCPHPASAAMTTPRTSQLIKICNLWNIRKL
jgi:hypothetical protein